MAQHRKQVFRDQSSGFGLVWWHDDMGQGVGCPEVRIAAMASDAERIVQVCGGVVHCILSEELADSGGSCGQDFYVKAV